MIYDKIDNWIIFQTPPSLLKSDLLVKIYARFSKALSKKNITYDPNLWPVGPIRLSPPQQ